MNENRLKELEKLEKICLEIYFARIAMNSQAVKDGLNKIDSYFRTENTN